MTEAACLDPRAEDQVLFNTVLFTGNANPALAREIASQLGVELGQALVARVTRRSASNLELTPGQPVYALIKAVAVIG